MSSIEHNNYRRVYAFAREMHPKTVQTDIEYGTAGFRTRANNLGYVMYRMGLLAVLRARHKKATIGVMITASHNPESDNGVKLVDPLGEMLDQSWEEWATKFANVNDDQLAAVIVEIITEFNIPMTDRVEIFVGKDTRPSSPELAKSLMDGIMALCGKPVDFGIVTTPQLHYFVACRNTKKAYGDPTEEGYYQKLTAAFRSIRLSNGADLTPGKYTNRLFYDGANGVGARKIMHFKDLLKECLTIEMYNNVIIGFGQLNHLCGADYVKSQQKFPTGVPREVNVRCCSVDGDADRLIYYYVDEHNEFHLLDGDRMSSLIAGYLKNALEKTALELSIGVVQTAYANGASTDYITNKLQVPVVCTATGVKHLYREALQFDIGIYFEANGHGTVLFSEHTKHCLKALTVHTDNNAESSSQQIAAQHFLQLIDLINETVGDAISDMLLIETILHAKGWNIQQWEDTYMDLPNCLQKVTVGDRRILTTMDSERRCCTPDGLQMEIDRLVEQYKRGRAFVRPSGTENVVRIYAEAAHKEDAQRLAVEVALKVYEMAGGVGEVPIVPPPPS